MQISERIWGKTGQGDEVKLFRITAENGAYTEFTNWGASWVSAVVPDRNGCLYDVLLGFSTLEGYLADNAYMGATIGRFANRIKGAAFHLGNELFKLDQNDGENNNHGGYSGFSHKLWDTKIFDSSVKFSLFSYDGEGGFPGNLWVEVIYSFDETNCLTIDFKGKSDRETFLNMTNHAYFNLNGEDNILSHSLKIEATKILDTYPNFIPTGLIKDVNGSPFNFHEPVKIGKQLFQDNHQLMWNKGYNHYFILDDKINGKLRNAALLFDQNTGRMLEMSTSLPGFVLYTGNYLEGGPLGKNGISYQPYSGVCLEAQFYPDSPNQMHFPSCIINSEKSYNERICFKFKVL